MMEYEAVEHVLSKGPQEQSQENAEGDVRREFLGSGDKGVDQEHNDDGQPQAGHGGGTEVGEEFEEIGLEQANRDGLAAGIDR